EINGWGWMESTVLNCVFDDAVLTGGSWAARVEDCSFRRARIREFVLGAWHNGRQGIFRRVDFSRADNRGNGGYVPDFIDCDFSNAKLHGCEWWQSGFIRFKFAGLVRG